MNQIQSEDKYKVYRALVEEPRSLECVSWIAGVSMITAANILDEGVAQGKVERKRGGYMLPSQQSPTVS